PPFTTRPLTTNHSTHHQIPTKEGRMTATSTTHAAPDSTQCDVLEAFRPYDLNGLKTYDLIARPSKVFHDDLGLPVSPEATVDQWLASLPKQLAAVELRRVSSQLCRAYQQGRTAAAVGGHVIKTGCAPYLIDWIQKGILKAVALNGSAAIHDFELAL